MKILRFISIVLVAAVAAGGLIYARGDRSALKKIVLDDCLAGNNDTSQCARVDRQDGFVLLKDRKGSVHYLLMPTVPIAGIESPALLDDQTPNYFELAWQQRSILSARFGRAIPDSRIILAINSEYGRTQDWLHIHMSCVLDAVRTKIDAVDQNDVSFWKPVAGDVLAHEYWIRRMTAQELHEAGPFKLLSAGIAGAAEDMGKFSLAMTRSRSGDFILLATRRNLLNFNLGSAEELQDQDCRGLPPSEGSSATG